MASLHSDEFKRGAVRIALTSGLTRGQVASDLGVGMRPLASGFGLFPRNPRRLHKMPSVCARTNGSGARTAYFARRIRLGQVDFSVHFLLSRSRAFASTSSLRMTAVIATFFSLPAAIRAAYFSFISKLNRIATSAGINIAWRKLGRPP